MIGLRVGPIAGPIVSILNDASDPLAGVTKDAASGIYTPASAAEWATLISVRGLSVAVPDALWLFQEASGNAADSIGGFTLTAGGAAASYQQSVSGWTRKAIAFADTATSFFFSTNASLPDVATQSMLTVIIAKSAHPSGQSRTITHGSFGTANVLYMNVADSITVESSTTVNGAQSAIGQVIPLGLRTNRTASSCVGFTHAEKVTPAFSSGISGKQITFGASATPPISILYGFQWNAANAEISDANYKAVLQAMGFTPSWSP